MRTNTFKIGTEEEIREYFKDVESVRKELPVKGERYWLTSDGVTLDDQIKNIKNKNNFGAIFYLVCKSVTNDVNSNVPEINLGIECEWFLIKEEK